MILKDEAGSVLNVSAVELVQKAVRTDFNSEDNEYLMWVYFKHRSEYVSIRYGRGKEAMERRDQDVTGIESRLRNMGLR